MSRIMKLVGYYAVIALDANMVENGARYSDKNVKILIRYQWIGERSTDEKTPVLA